MVKPKEIAEIALALWYLPAEKVAEVGELVRQLRREHGLPEPVDDSDDLDETARRDIALATFRRFEAEHPDEDWGTDYAALRGQPCPPPAT
ncbi:MAG: hypothetical protein K2X87_35245 [Gemmataceae bacterium]|nr:hypothetical protein [Gemmataceae bacterium]